MMVSSHNTSQIGIAGLAVMGENLVLNLASKGFSVAVYNRTTSKMTHFVQGRGKNPKITGCSTVEEFVRELERPRKVMMMVKAGEPVDQFIEQLLPYLEPGDIIIDGGNSLYTDTQRRVDYLAEKQIHFVGCGVSGGEEGALKGPSIMPGGAPEAWKHIEPILVPISAKVADGTHCCTWMGKSGAGHFVKMVHNGIEYGDMQLICEMYDLMKNVLAMSHQEMHTTFKQWNEGELNSYLIEITADILLYTDTDGTPLLENILDTAGQKGTGKWTARTALDFGLPLSLIGESVFARCLSALKEERVQASTKLQGPQSQGLGSHAAVLEDARKALYLAKIISYAQGFTLFRAASEELGWELNYAEIARIWRGGCIIRSAFLDTITKAFTEQPNLTNLLLAPEFTQVAQEAHMGLRNILTLAINAGVSVPSLSSALSYYDGYRAKRLPANLLQAQRDYFGAHTYERVDQPRGTFFHTDWTGEGGDTTSTTYSR